MALYSPCSCWPSWTGSPLPSRPRTGQGAQLLGGPRGAPVRGQAVWPSSHVGSPGILSARLGGLLSATLQMRKLRPEGPPAGSCWPGTLSSTRKPCLIQSPQEALYSQEISHSGNEECGRCQLKGLDSVCMACKSRCAYLLLHPAALPTGPLVSQHTHLPATCFQGCPFLPARSLSTCH